MSCCIRGKSPCKRASSTFGTHSCISRYVLYGCDAADSSSLMFSIWLCFVQTFNAAPGELVIRDSLLFSSCVDGPSSSSPTCGWFTDYQGNNVPDSQGFCCSYSIGDVITGGGDDSRGNLDCSLFGSAGKRCVRGSIEVEDDTVVNSVVPVSV